MELLDRIVSVARIEPGRAAFIDATSGTTLTYGQLCANIDRVSRDLSTHLPPTGRGAALLNCGNRIEFPIWLLALLHSGFDVLPLPTDSTTAELESFAGRIEAAIVISDSTIVQRNVRNVSIENVHDCPRAIANIESRSVRTGDLLLASSGSTAIPKIARRTAASLDAVSRNMVDAIGVLPRDRVLAAVPLSHSYGIEHGLLAPLWAGATAVLVRGMDWPTLTATLCSASGGVTILPAVPAMIEMLAMLGDRSFTMPSLRMVYSAGGQLPRESAAAFATRFGLRVGQVYGMTEIGSVTFNSPRDEPFDGDSVGRKMNGVSIRIVSPDASGAGEIAIAAPSMLSEYLDESADGSEWIDGHFPTGDVGRLDDLGRLHISGRAKLMIDVGGKKVNPLEIESVLAAHPGVLECAVLPVRQSESINRLCALIVPRESSGALSDQSIRAFVRERLSPYKVPRMIRFQTQRLPRSASGKLLRHLLEPTL